MSDEKCILIVEFSEPGSTDFQVTGGGQITVNQLEAVAHHFLAEAQYIRWTQVHQRAMAEAQRAMEQTEAQRIFVPNMQMPQGPLKP